MLQDRWDAGVAVDARRPRAVLVHARRHDVPPGPRARRRPRRSAPRRLAAVLRLRRRAGAARARRARGRAHGIQVLRLYGSTEVLVGTWNRPRRSRSASAHRRRRHDRRRVEVRDDGASVVLPASPARSSRGARTRASGFFDDPSAPRRPSTATAGCAPATSSRSTTTGTSPSSAARRRSSSAAASTSRRARSRSSDRRLPRGASGPRWSGLPDERLGERSVRVRRAPNRARRSTSTTVVERLRGDRSWRRTSCPQRLEVLDALPTTASGKIQKHEIVRHAPASRRMSRRDRRRPAAGAAVRGERRPTRSAVTAGRSTGPTSSTRSTGDMLDALDARPRRRRGRPVGARRARHRQRPGVQRRRRPQELPAPCSATRSRSRGSSRSCTGSSAGLRTLPVPAVALVNGVAAAGGLELLLNCDFALVARIGAHRRRPPELRADGRRRRAHAAAPRDRQGARRRADLHRAASSTPTRPSSWGLVNRVVADDELLDGRCRAGRPGSRPKSPLAVANAKEVMQTLWADNGSVDAGLRYERERNAYYCLTSDDAAEGLAAFAEKRPPEFRGPMTTPVPIADADSERLPGRRSVGTSSCSSAAPVARRAVPAACRRARGAAAPSPSRSSGVRTRARRTRGSACTAP